MNLSVNSDQLRLRLFDDLPWDGVSPRFLTRGFIPLFLRQKPPSHEVFFDPEQLELWPEASATQREEPQPELVRVGASLLLKHLPRRSRGTSEKPFWQED